MMTKEKTRRLFLAAGFLPFLAKRATAQSEQHFHTTAEEMPPHYMMMGPDDDPVLAAALKQKVTLLRGLSPMEFLTAFDYGSVVEGKGGQKVREFHITATDARIEVAPGLFFDAWTYNGSVPGPTLRCTEGDVVRVYFTNQGKSEHTIHFHSIHQAKMDGVYELVRPGESTVYEFTAAPAGLQLYHCHAMPVALHMTRGLFGVLIIDPRALLPPAKEMVMVLHAWDTNFDRKNELYAINGAVNFFRDNPIPLRTGETVRLYLVNVMEYEPVSSFHIHANFFKLFRTGNLMQPPEYSDIVTLSQAERCILEFSYRSPGRYMFHPHQNLVAERGCMGDFLVS